MLDEQNRNPAALSGNLGAAVPFVRPPELGDAAPTSDRGAGNAGGLPETRPVRIGRTEPNPVQQPLPKVLSARSAESSGGVPMPSRSGSAAAKGVLADMADRRSAGLDIAKSISDLNTKIDTMKESFDILEAHVAVGLSRSIAETIRAEISALELQFAQGQRYRARYSLALSVALLLAAAIVADQYRPFIDALFEPVRQGFI